MTKTLRRFLIVAAVLSATLGPAASVSAETVTIECANGFTITVNVNAVTRGEIERAVAEFNAHNPGGNVCELPD